MLDFLKKLFRSRAAGPPAAPASLRAALVGQEGAEAGLRHSEQQFEQLVSGVRDYAVFLLDRQGHVRTWNTGAERIKGYAAGEIVGQHFSRFYPGEAVSSGWPAHELSVASATGRFEDEGWRLRKDGSRFWANVVITALRDEAGEVRGFLKITRDLTDRRQAEEKLRLSEERFRLMVEGVKDYAIFLLDPEGRVATWNEGARRIKGYGAEEIIGQHFSRFYPREAVERGWPEEELRRASAEGRFEDEGWRLRKDGSRFWANVVITALRDEGGTLRGFAKVTRDLTERRQAEENARRLLQEEAARRAAEEAAREIERQREQLRVTLASIGDAVIVTDTNGDVTFLNPVAAGLTGWGPQEAAGQPLERVFPLINEETRQAVENPVRRAFREGKVVELANHTALLTRDGREVPIEDSAAPIPGEGGDSTGGGGPATSTGAVLVFRDVTEARRAVEARLYLAAIVESSDDAIIGHTLDGKIASWNRGAERLYGYAAGEVVGKPLSVLVPPDHPDELPAITERVRRGECIDHFETQRVRKDGSRVDVSLTISPVRNGEGKVIGASKIARDITDRRRAEEALRAGAERLQLALAAARLGDWSWDAATDVVTFSGRAAEIFGIPPGPHMTWTRMQGLLHPEDRERARLLVEQAVAGRGQYETEYRVNRPDGTQVWVAALGRASYSPSGQALGMYGVVQDITARKRQEEALREEARITETLRRIGLALAGELDLHRLVQTVTDEATRLTDARFGAFFYNVRDERGEAYTLYTLSGVPREAFASFPMPRNTAIFDPTFQGEATVRLGDVTRDPRFGNNAPYHGMPEGHLPVRSYLAVPVKSRSGEVLGGLFFGHPQPGVFSERDERLVEGIAAQAAVALDNARLFESAQRQRVRAEEGEQVSRFLADASATLASLVDYESTLQKIARLAVPRFADWAAVDMAGEGGRLQRLAVAHADPAKVELAHELERRYPPDPDGAHGAYHVLRTGRPEMMTDVPDALLEACARDEGHLRMLRGLGLKSYVCVPLTVRGKTLGVLSFASAESGRRYGAADLAVAEDLAHRAAVAVENAQLYKEVREQDRRKDEFLAMLAHELRNPLAPVRNGLQILRMPGLDAGTVGRAREMMERQVEHLVRMVDDLMDVSRIMRGKIELRREPVELAAVVARAVETAQPALDAGGHELTVRLPEGPLRVFGDVVRLTQVVSNLLVNACKYSERAGHVWVTGGREGGSIGGGGPATSTAGGGPATQVVLRVRDSGVGIAREDLGRIFDLFAQVDRSVSRSQSGLGIGLTLVKRLVEMHGGTVTARSEGPGRGSEFEVRLPALAEGGEAAPEAPRADGPAAPARRILIVDDNVDAAESLAMMLRLLGHEVWTAYDGPAALETATRDRPDVILLDIGLPGMSGYEVAERLRRQPPFRDTLLAAMTGYGQEEDRRRSREAGFDHHLVKPVDPAALKVLLASPAPGLDR